MMTERGPTAAHDRERALEFVATIVEALPNPVFVKDEQHQWVLLNDKFCRLMDFDWAQLLGKSDYEFFPKEEADVFWAKDDLVFATGEVVENEERFTDGAGRLHVLITRKSLHVSPEGRRFLVGVITDITERKQIEEELRESRQHLEQRIESRTAELRRVNERLHEQDRAKDEFLAVLSHELRNPLAPIRNSLWLLDNSPPGGEKAGRARDTINRQVLHLTRLIDDLLDVTRVSRGKVTLQKARIDLADLVLRTLEDHRTLFSGRSVSLCSQLPQVPLWVQADPTRIAQMVGNLLANAAKFSRGGGNVDVVVERGPGVAIVRVRDDGAGIDPAFLERMFEPFIQADTTLDRTRGGLGLGLSLVKGLVELHGGSVQATSAGRDCGAEFVIRLPLAREAPAVEEGIRPAPESMPHRKVLVVEDNVDAAESLREMLLYWEHEVEVAHDGIEGLEKARAFRPDLVLCDIGLPGMDGYAIARAIRADEALAPTFLVAVTGYASPDEQRKAGDAGFNRHLAKPVPIDLIEEVLATSPRIAS